MSDYPTDLSGLTGPQLVRLFLDAAKSAPATDPDRAAFFDFKARLFTVLAQDGNPDAADVADRARLMRDRILVRIDSVGGGDR
ncbi:hypothetical protein DFP74_2727 [Nocardiopsis sp. Huas11]|uniref:hypothetical protein n=1 Tax=Nocardiopsis sp. Huas11 TaxID=2183912 RepID=UPI000EAF34F3|nr:hypothetical protein [Nocardiopsis sp. Huas11]RKS07072.1 hypothetical protein DFP74_2727 [Nocardiopsis sp. Huas11]